MSDKRSPKSKKIDVGGSSLVDLKAELARKQEQARRDKFQAEGEGTRVTRSRAAAGDKKPLPWSKKNVGIEKRSERDIEQHEEEEKSFSNSRAALEAKVKLYEHMSSGLAASDLENTDRFLVDFERKAKETMATPTKKRGRPPKKKNAEDEADGEMSTDLTDADSLEAEWVDYTDALGRSRRCLKKDLPDVIKMDRDLGRGAEERAENPDLLSEDMRREREREAWEKQAQQEAEKPVGPEHYQNVRNNEIRDLGVGYYAFSEDEGTRQQQMEQLKQLREETVEQRDKREKLKEKRKSALHARLEKVKQRKKLKGIEEPEEFKEEEEKEDAEETVSIELEQKPPPPIREWDRGKVYHRELTQDEWIEKRRGERPTQFAPSYP
ncbi:PREDICTED: coiled-coil domain-containing protein 174-like [Priapulus caudatus]|uniref:Coiled-coil domain-containing protein 174-like n=1 Tax=Priapulus caudatus TaxID=37621 RepID=A0ABM1EY96_PRICU|nr:PREDICTED: coiled-coil domain-containing protein 174-like [Priapulus caudatus]